MAGTLICSTVLLDLEIPPVLKPVFGGSTLTLPVTGLCFFIGADFIFLIWFCI